MACDSRFELRMPDSEWRVLKAYAKSQGVPAAAIVRRGLRIVIGHKQPLEQDQRREVDALRKRISAIQARVEAASVGSTAATLDAELATARLDAQALLDR